MSTFSMGKFRASLFAAVLAAAPLSPVLHAEDPGMGVKVNVPFAFETGSGHFTAGVYTIRMQSGHIMLIKGVSGSGLAMTRVDEDVEPAKKGKAVFRRYGDQYFLREIWIEGKRSHLHCVESKAERRLQVAGNKTASTGMELALLEMPR